MTTPTRLVLATPDTWRGLPLGDDAALQRAVASVIAERFRGVDDQPLLRRSAEADLLGRARDARDQGGVEMYLSTELAGGVPLALTLVVSRTTLPSGRSDLAAAARELDDLGAQVAQVELPAGPAVRRRRVATPDLVAAYAGASLDSVLVDYLLAAPDGGLVLLSFASPLVEVADALAELFEAVASTARWEVEQ